MNSPTVRPHNVGRWCLSEDECIARGIDFAAYERGVADAAAAFALDQRAATAPLMLSLLKDLIDIEGPQPGNAMWAAKVRSVIKRAEGKTA